MQVMLFAHPHKSSYHTFQKLDQAVNMVQWENVPGFATVHPHGANWADFKPYDPVSNLEKPLLNVTQPSDVPCNQVSLGHPYGIFKVALLFILESAINVLYVY